ncbi:MAG: DUF5058 family protein [Clostridia bacterium]|nr:DUF5058 family protein [Clostridia bacterium]
MDFKESKFMYLMASFIIVFVIAQSLFFMIRAWRHGKEIGMKTSDLKNTVTSSALFTIAPAIAILATVITLAGTLGLVLPWIRLTVIGNLQYEVTAAQAAMEGFEGTAAIFGTPIKDPKVFAAVSWVMTLGSISPLFLCPLFLKLVQKKMGKVSTAGGDGKLGDIISAATFIGLVAAFIGVSVAGKAPTLKINGQAVKDTNSMGAGVLSVSVLLTSIIVFMLLQWLCKKFNLKKLETFIMPISMFVGMGMAMVIYHFAPDIAKIEWRPVS